MAIEKKCKSLLLLTMLLGSISFAASLPNLLKYPLTSSSDLPVGYAVRMSDENEIELCDSDDKNVIGVIIGKEDVSGSRYYLIAQTGIQDAVVDGAVEAGDKLTTAADGTLRLAIGSEVVVAIAMQDAATDPDTVKVMLSVGFAPGSQGDITAVGSMTSGDVFANSSADDDWLGLGLTGGRIEFEDEAIDEILVLDANVGIGTIDPTVKLDVYGEIASGGNGQDGKFIFYSEQGGTDYTFTLVPNAAMTQNVLLTLPADDGTVGQALVSDGSGNLSWETNNPTDVISVDTIEAKDGDSIIIRDRIVLADDAVVWDDLRVPATVAKVAGANDPDYTAYKGSIRIFKFLGTPNSNIDEVFFDVQLPHSWKEGTDIHPHVHFVPIGAVTGAQDTIVWQLEYMWVNTYSTFSSTTTVADTTEIKASPSDVDRHMMGGFPKISGTGKTISSMLVCRMFRDAGHAVDTYQGEAGLLEIDFHYQIDGFGSKEETTK